MITKGELSRVRKEAHAVVGIVAARVAERLAADADAQGIAYWKAKYEAAVAELEGLRRAAAIRSQRRRDRAAATLRDGTSAADPAQPAATPGAKK